MTPSEQHGKPALIEPEQGFKIHLLVFVLATHAWALGVVAHYLGVYVLKQPKDK